MKPQKWSYKLSYMMKQYDIPSYNKEFREKIVGYHGRVNSFGYVQSIFKQDGYKARYINVGNKNKIEEVDIWELYDLERYFEALNLWNPKTFGFITRKRGEMTRISNQIALTRKVIPNV